MLTIEGFIKGCQADGRRTLWYLAIICILMIVCVFPFVVWSKYHPNPGAEERKVVGYLGIGLFILNIAAMIGGLFLISRRMEKNPLTSCPHCSKQLRTDRSQVFST